MNESIPKHILDSTGLTKRQWKSRKRQELKVIRRAYDDFKLGCAFCPGPIADLQKAIIETEQAMSINKWGE